MRRILRTSHEHRRRASLKSDEENLINPPERRHSLAPNIDNRRRKSLPAYAFFTGQNNQPKTQTYTARKKLRRFLTIKDEAFESKYLVTVGIMCVVVLLIIILSLYQLLID